MFIQVIDVIAPHQMDFQEVLACVGEYNLLCKHTIKTKIYCYKVSSETRRDFFGVSSVSFSSDEHMIVQCLSDCFS